MKRTVERLLIASFLLLSAAFAAHAQKAPRSALQISAENISAHAARHGDSTRVLLAEPPSSSVVASAQERPNERARLR